MATRLPDPLLSRLSELVADQMGLHFPQARWSDLQRGAESAAGELGFKDAESCVQWLIASPASRPSLEILASHLTVGETYFFREKRSFEILQEHILPELIQSRRGAGRRLRIWSAGCCTGEEPYSIAILLTQMIPDLASWNITILATDINPRFLKKAAEAVYGSWSFREAPQSLKERYFHEKRSGSFELFPHIKAMVTFAYLNLAEDTYPSLLNNTNAMDVILCRNVLMYFAPDRLKQAARNLRLSLLERGWLLVSPTEASHVLDSEFETVHFPGATLYRNGKKAKPPVFAQAAEREESFSQALDLFPLFTGERISLEESADVSSTSEVEGAEAGTVRPDLYAVAMELYRQGRYAEAADSVLPNLSANPKDFQAMALLARSYANLGRLAEALELSEKALAFNKLDAGLHYLRAMILQELSFADATVESLKRALYLDQNSVLCYFALGNLARRRGQFKESAKYFDNALSLLNSYGRDEILPESEGITAGRLIEVIQSTHNK